MSNVTWPEDGTIPIPIGRPPRPNPVIDGVEKSYPNYKGIQCHNCNEYGHHVRKCPNQKRRAANMHCIGCNAKGHKSSVCPFQLEWLMKKRDHKTLLGQLFCLKFNHKMVVQWNAKIRDFSDFIGCVKKAYAHTHKFCGGVLITPEWYEPNAHVPKWRNEKVVTTTQSFKKISTGVYLADEWTTSGSQMNVFEKKSAQTKLEKVGHRDMNNDINFFNTALGAFEHMSQTGDFPLYVMEHDDTTKFPHGSTNDWHMYPLKRTFSSILKNPEEIMKGVNAPQLLLGQVFSYTPWHVEDQDFPSLNYNHTGDDKMWLLIPESYRGKFENLCEERFPDCYKQCKAAHLHKLFVIFPHILQTTIPPIPFHWVRQRPGQYVATWPGAYHMVINAGTNIAEAMNFADPEWTEKFSGKDSRCDCQFRKKIDLLRSKFNFKTPLEQEASTESSEGNTQPELLQPPAEAPAGPSGLSKQSSSGNLQPSTTVPAQPEIRPSTTAAAVSRTLRMNPCRSNWKKK